MIEIDRYIKDNFLEPKLDMYNFFWYAPRINILRAVQASVPAFFGHVVDLGCGVMPYKKLICANEKVTKYTGIDLEISDYHQKVKPDLFWNGTAIPLESASADCLLATEFLEHYPNPDLILKEMYRVLKVGGFILATTPFIWNLHEIPYDEYRYTPYALERHFKQSGFSNITVKPTSGWDNSLATMLALWLEAREMSRKRKKWLRKIIFPIYKYLLKTDNPPEKFDNWHNSMSQGFVTTAYKY